MFRYLRSDRKGQFFIIAAVIIVSALFSIHAVYLGYYAVDTSVVQDLDSTFLLNDIEKETLRLHDYYNKSPCSDIRNHLSSSKMFIERAGLESGNFIRFNYDISRGCIETTFNVEISSRDSKVSKSFTASVPHEDTFINKYNSGTFASDIESNSNVNVDSTLSIAGEASSGTIIYYFDPETEVVWYENLQSTIPASTSNVVVTWLINDSRYCSSSPNYCEYTSFDDLPEEFRWFKQKITLNRLADGSSPHVTSANLTYAKRT